MSESTGVDRSGHRPASGVAARGYSWPPFEAGNELATRHGAFSPRKVEPRAAELVDQVLDDPGTAYLQAHRWRAALWAWARAEVRVELLSEYLADHVGGAGLDAEGDISPALRALAKWESVALHHRGRLGLDPLSAARLGRDQAAGAVDMAKLLSGLEDAPERPATLDGDGRTGTAAGSGAGQPAEGDPPGFGEVGR